MKRGITIVLAALLLAGCATTQTATSTEYAKVIETGKPAAQTFDLVMKWMAKYFVSPKSVIQYSDRASGLVTGKATTIVMSNFAATGEMEYTLTIEIRDGRVRFSFIANDYIASSGANRFSQPITEEIFRRFTVKADELLATFDKYMKEAPADW